MALQHDPEKQARLDFEGDTTVPAPIYDKSYSEHHDAASPTSYDPILDRYSDADIKRVVRKSVITLVFFITYVIAQPPTTILVRFFGPRMWLATITLCWGATMIGFGFVKEWKTLVGLRLILGILEHGLDHLRQSGFFPGVVYLLSTWYKRYEVGKRYSIFYFIGSMASALGGILAYGLMQMEGTQGYGGWRWIFIIEGCVCYQCTPGSSMANSLGKLTCGVAFLGYIFLVSFPDNTKSRSIRFLTEEQRQIVIARVNQDRADADLEKFTFKRWLGGAVDWKIWAYGACFGCATTVSYALAYFLPIILNLELGYDTGTAQCLIAPPYAFAGIIMFATGWFGDKYHQRGLCVAFNAMLCIIGLAVMGWAYHDSRARYFGVFFATAGSNANVPSVLTYQANNIRGQWKRAFCSATLVGGGALGGIVGSTVFRSEDSPKYIPGLSVAMGSQVVILILVGALTATFMANNKKADQGEKVLEDLPEFRYTI
ncbi:MAG: hypothetical protein L6R41_002464 [Letrouitia leprolyta]|nr:MAG: hypothetical protein L6R41_002464 [Letrouitia leprolyta]